MGIGRAEGERRACRAAEEAIVCPLLEQSNINGATGVIVNIRGGRDIGMRELEEAVTVVKEAAHPHATLFVGAVLDEEEHPELEVTVIAAGFAAVPTDLTAMEPEKREEPATEEVASLEPDAPAEEPFAPDEAQEAEPAEPAAVGPGGQTEFLPPEPPVRRRSVGVVIADTFESDLQPQETAHTAYRDDEDIGIPTWWRKRKKLS